jgi:hypothetical protein
MFVVWMIYIVTDAQVLVGMRLASNISAITLNVPAIRNQTSSTDVL